MCADFLERNYDQFFNRYRDLLNSENYVTRRQSLKVRMHLRRWSKPSKARHLLDPVHSDTRECEFEYFEKVLVRPRQVHSHLRTASFGCVRQRQSPHTARVRHLQTRSFRSLQSSAHRSFARWFSLATFARSPSLFFCFSCLANCCSIVIIFRWWPSILRTRTISSNRWIYWRRKAKTSNSKHFTFSRSFALVFYWLDAIWLTFFSLAFVLVLFRYSWPTQQNQKLSLIFCFVIEKDWSNFWRRSTLIVSALLDIHSSPLIVDMPTGTDDEQFNDEKAYLIKQISELKDTKAWDTFSFSFVYVLCV